MILTCSPRNCVKTTILGYIARMFSCPSKSGLVGGKCFLRFSVNFHISSHFNAQVIAFSIHPDPFSSDPPTEKGRESFILWKIGAVSRDLDEFITFNMQIALWMPLIFNSPFNNRRNSQLLIYEQAIAKTFMAVLFV